MTSDVGGTGMARSQEGRKDTTTPLCRAQGGQGESLGLTLPKGGGRADPTRQRQVETQRKRPGGDQQCSRGLVAGWGEDRRAREQGGDEVGRPYRPVIGPGTSHGPSPSSSS